MIDKGMQLYEFAIGRVPAPCASFVSLATCLRQQVYACHAFHSEVLARAKLDFLLLEVRLAEQ